VNKPKTEEKDRVVFIDRDGVINWDPVGDYIRHWKHFRFLPGVIDSLKKLCHQKFRIILISNQAGIGDGEYPEANLRVITLNMLNALERKGVDINSVYYCLHGKKEGCECRKPKIRLLEWASNKLSYSKSKTFFIGDKATDVIAGRKFGLNTILVLTGHGKKDRLLLNRSSKPDYIVPSLKEAVQIVIKK